MKLFSFHWQTYKILYPLMYPLFYLLRQISYDLIKNINLAMNPFVMTTLMFLSELICGIFEPFRRCLSKGSKYKQIKHEVPHGKTKIMDFLEEKIKRSGHVIIEIIAILVIALLDYAGFIIISFTNIWEEKAKDGSNNPLFYINDLSAATRMSEILFLSLLTVNILGYNIYKHHNFARVIQMINIFLLIIFLFILVVCYKLDDTDPINTINRYLSFILYTALYLISFFLYSCKNICIKWMIEKRFYSPFLLIFYVGLAGLVCMAVTFLITYNFIPCPFAFCKPDKTKATNQNLIEINEIWYIVSSFICGSIINLFQYITNFYFNPCYIGIGNSLAGFLLWFYYCFTSFDLDQFGVHKTVYWILIVICGFIYIVSFFACLVYTENIICYFWKLNENVTNEIMNRAEKDVNNSQDLLNNEISLVEQEPDNRDTQGRESGNELGQ